MQEQNFKNHSRIIPSFHFALLGLLLAIIVGSLVNLAHSYHGDGFYSSALICVISFVLPVIALFARSFGLKAQDRAIRAEENLRYFAITGKLLDSKLKLSQVIALRFAPNNEFVDLAHRAVAENLTAKQIKQAIQHWKADEHRV